MRVILQLINSDAPREATRKLMLVVNVRDVVAQPLAKGSARGVRVKHLIDRESGARNFFLRYYEVEPGGQTPYDAHDYEHEVYVLRGKGIFLTNVAGVPMMTEIGEGDAVLVASKQIHQFINNGDVPLTFLCVKGAEELYGASPQAAERSEGS